MAVVLLLCTLLLGLAGCGEDAETAAPATTTELVVRLDHDGPQGPAAAKQLHVTCGQGDASAACRTAERLKPGDFSPVPDNVACTEIFGGPQTARISGTLRGERVAATFSRSNGCEINRWETVAPLLAEVR
jgi:hypothetical protein